MPSTASKKIEGFSTAITIEKNIDFQVGINAKDNKTAKDFANISNLGLGSPKAKVEEQAKQNEKFAPVLDVINSIRATSQGNNLMIRGQISFRGASRSSWTTCRA